MVAPVTATINTFIDYALSLVVVMILYYGVKFFLVERKPEDQQALSQRRNAFKEWLQRRNQAQQQVQQQAAEQAQSQQQERRDQQQHQQQERRTREQERARPEMEQVATDLLGVISSVDEASKAVADGKKDKAQEWITKAKRYLTRAKDSDALEKIARDTLYYDQAKALRAEIVKAKDTLGHLPLDEAQLRSFNQYIGAIVKRMGEVIQAVFSHTPAAPAVPPSSSRRGRAVGSRPVAVVRRRR